MLLTQSVYIPTFLSQLVLALASMVKTEILWFMSHQTEEKRKGTKGKAAGVIFPVAKVRMQYSAGKRPGIVPVHVCMTCCIYIHTQQVAELVGLLDCLGLLVSEHMTYIKEYYRDYLKGAQNTSLVALLPHVG